MSVRIFRVTMYLLLFLQLMIIPCLAEFSLTLLHTNDCRTRIEETDGQGGTCTRELSNQQECFGGVARRSTVLNDIRTSHQPDGNILLLDTGDEFQGTNWFYVYKGNATAHFMNMLGYNAMGLGKYEFVRGIPMLESFLKQADFTIVSSNINATYEPEVEALITGSYVIDIGGDQIGIVGCTNPDVPNIADSGNLIFMPTIQALQTAVNALINDHGVNKIIALSASSFDLDQEIAGSVVGVDIVVGGHSQTFLYTGEAPDGESKDGDYPMVINPTYDESLDILLVTAYHYGKYLGHLEVSFDDGGVVTSYNGNPILLNSSVVPDPIVQSEVDDWAVLVQDVSTTAVGVSTVNLDGSVDVCGKGECPLGNMVADAMLYDNGFAPDAAASAMTTAGSFASSIVRGRIIVNDLTRVLPYGDSIDLLQLTGTTIKEILETPVTDFDPTIDSTTAFLQISGMKVEYDLTRPNGDRVLSAYLRCLSSCSGQDEYEALDLGKVYGVIMNSYVAGGEESYPFIPDETLSRDRGIQDVDVVIDYLDEYSPVSPEVEGRVVIYDSTNRPPSG